MRPDVHEPPPTTEERLFRAYRVPVSPHYRTESCACGEDIRAETGWEAAAVDEHNGGLRHAAWRVEFRARWQ